MFLMESNSGEACGPPAQYGAELPMYPYRYALPVVEMHTEVLYSGIVMCHKAPAENTTA